jgi:DNA-binding NarL/FixJ family response regulator
VYGPKIPQLRDVFGGFRLYTGIIQEEERMARYILIADDQPQVRRALRLLLEQELGATVVGEAAAAKTLLAQVATGCPDLVLMDWGLPGIAAPNLLEALREDCPALAVIVLSGQPEAEQDALRAGADAFVSKADPPERLLAAIHSTG